MAISIDNASSRVAQHALMRNQVGLQASLQRLSTGFRINAGADDPAGLIASELLRNEKAVTTAAIANAQRADQVLATADGTLAEVSNMLISLQGLVVASANSGGLTGDERDANQLQIDSILSTIDRLANTSSFAGRKLLSGELAFQLSGGPGMNLLHNLTVHDAAVGTSVTQPATVQLVASAQHAALVFHGTAGGLAAPVDVWLTGNTGSVQLSFASGVKASAVTHAINSLTESVGITASATGNDVALSSTGYGSSQFVSVQANNTNFQATTLSALYPVTRAIGRDATVAINGQTVQSDGLDVHYASDTLTASFTLDEALNQAGKTASFNITGGGAQFLITPHVDTGGLAVIGLPQVHTGSIGRVVEGGVTYSLADLGDSRALSLARGREELGQKVVLRAITDVAQLRGRIGAFRKFTVGSQIQALGVTLENLSSAESSIRDTDFASETAELTRRQILVSASQSALLAANQNYQTILKLLGS